MMHSALFYFCKKAFTEHTTGSIEALGDNEDLVGLRA